MSGQINDTVSYEGREYGIRSGQKGLFSPRTYGMHTVCQATFCRRGYVAYYLVEEEHIFLTRLDVDLGGVWSKEKVPAPPIEGHEAADGAAGEHKSMFEYVYSGMRIPLAITGSLILRDDLVEGMGTGWGFQPDSTFRTVLELDFEEGRLLSVKDLSEKYAAERAEPGFFIQTLF